MNFSFEHPLFLYAVFLPIPIFFIQLKRFKTIQRNYRTVDNKPFFSSLFAHSWSAFTLRAFSWIFFILSCAGISWGTDYVPIEKNGCAIAFVFDISHSMEARDVQGGKTRLQAAGEYAMALLDYLPQSSISVTLAKGNGMVAVPLTEDYQALSAIFSSLSPRLMTSAGSSLGSGIKAAISSFPSQTSLAQNIWLFTDGEETDESLEEALQYSLKYGIPVSIIGFGSTLESQVFAGDGKTTVQTALRVSAIQNVIDSVLKKNASLNKDFLPQIQFVDSNEASSAYKLLNSLKTDSSVSYEIRPIEHHSTFLAISILLLLLSFIFSETQFNFRKTFSAFAFTLVLSLCFTSCSARFYSGKKILSGKISWNHGDYSEATLAFLEAAQNAKYNSDPLSESYAIFNLSATYLAQGEKISAEERLGQISFEDSPKEIQFAILYNKGIIAHQNGNFSDASEYFKEALKINSLNLNAKINLEICLKEQIHHFQNAEQKLIPVFESKAEYASLEDAIYSILREKEQNQWKNQQQQEESSALDY